MKLYTVEYKMHIADLPKAIDIEARNKAEAYDKAVYEEICERENEMPYSAWVACVRYKNGKFVRFNTFEGMPY